MDVFEWSLVPVPKCQRIYTRFGNLRIEAVTVPSLNLSNLPRNEKALVRVEGRRPELMIKGHIATTEPTKAELMCAKLRLLRRRVKRSCCSSFG